MAQRDTLVALVGAVRRHCDDATRRRIVDHLPERLRPGVEEMLTGFETKAPPDDD